jgi:hypothetical protein
LEDWNNSISEIVLWDDDAVNHDLKLLDLKGSSKGSRDAFLLAFCDSLLKTIFSGIKSGRIFTCIMAPLFLVTI